MVIDSILLRGSEFIFSIPEDQRIIVSLVIYSTLIIMFSLFIWKYYRFLGRRDIIKLNLKQYNYSTHPVLEKILAVSLYILEYLVILPFLAFFWFTILSLFLLIFSEINSTEQILLIATAIITSTRVTAYISEDISKEIAKLLPFNILAALLIGTDFFNFLRIIDRINQIPGLLSNIFFFLIFIFVIEFIFRILFLGIEIFVSEKEESD